MAGAHRSRVGARTRWFVLSSNAMVNRIFRRNIAFLRASQLTIIFSLIYIERYPLAALDVGDEAFKVSGFIRTG
jgi:hypothetical protein